MSLINVCRLNKNIETAGLKWPNSEGPFEKNTLAIGSIFVYTKCNKCKTFNARTRKTVHFYQYERVLTNKLQTYAQLTFQDFNQSVGLKNNL